MGDFDVWLFGSVTTERWHFVLLEQVLILGLPPQVVRGNYKKSFVLEGMVSAINVSAGTWIKIIASPNTC